MNLLLTLAIVFGVLVLVRVANIARMAADLSGEDEEAEQDKSNKWNSLGFLLFGFLGLGLVVYSILEWMPLTLPVSASEHGVEIDYLMNINWAVLFPVFFLTNALLFIFAYKYRYNRNRRSYYFHDNNTLEAVWTIVPTIVLAGLIVTGLLEWNKITDAALADKGMKIQVYAKQFDFTARYAGKDNELGSSYFKNIADDNPLGIDVNDKTAYDDIMSKELVMPVGMDVELVINSRDVIHSVYLPHFRAQMNAVPGMTTRFHFKPTITTARMKEITGNDKFEYVMLCNKICGVAHYNMKMPVRVVEMEEFKTWIKGEKPAITRKDAGAPVTPEAPAAADTTAKPVAMK